MRFCFYCRRWRMFWLVKDGKCRNAMACAQHMAAIMRDL